MGYTLHGHVTVMHILPSTILCLKKDLSQERKSGGVL